MVTKIPRFAFEKFPQADSRLTTQMKSVGEVMAIGRTFQESFQKALRGLETGIDGLDERYDDLGVVRGEITDPGPERILYVADAFRLGLSLGEINGITHIDPWYLVFIEDLIIEEREITKGSIKDLDQIALKRIKQKGFSDRRIAKLLDIDEGNVRDLRNKLSIHPVFKRVDTCAAEFDTNTAYMYSTYEEECE